MEQRQQLIQAYHTGLYSMSELCMAYGVSRKTGYKWLTRYREGGSGALENRSSAPRRSPQRMDPKIEALLVETRRARPRWGPRKILPWIARKYPALADQLPAPSTVGDLYRRHGLVKPRKRRRPIRFTPAGKLITGAPNEVWTADFKGEFRLRKGPYCYPFTLADAHTRFLLACQAERSTALAGVRATLLEAFRTYGLPRAIRTDNGIPFVTYGQSGLSRLSVWWIKLGIRHQRIAKARPDQNGRHERMHRTLKAETTRPAESSLIAQQTRFDHFRMDFNTERPHEALGQQTPASCYQCSARPYPEQIEPPRYPPQCEVRKVDSKGHFKFRGATHFLAHPLAGEFLGLVEIADDIWSVHFYDHELGRLNPRTGNFFVQVLPMSPV